MSNPPSTTTPTASGPDLRPCPFCGGPAEKRLTDGPKRGFIGCFTCMVGLPFNAPYGDVEVVTWNSRVSVNKVDGYQPCPDARCNDQLGPFPIPQCVTAVAWAEEADAIAGVLRQMSDQFNGVDNGHCTICPGFRLYDTKGKVGPCDNAECLSHRISEILKRYEKPSASTLERIQQGALARLHDECSCGTTKDAYGCPNGH